MQERLLSGTQSLPVTGLRDLFFSSGLLVCTLGAWLEWG